MNVAIQTEDELICLYTDSVDRAEKVCKKGNIIVTDMYEVQDDEMQYYCFDARVYDPNYVEALRSL